MALLIHHSFVSPKLDGPDPTIVRPSNWNDEHEVSGSGWLVAGMVIDFIGHTVPSYLLECFGQSVAASAYPTLFATMVKQSTVTLTIASPGVVNWNTHGLSVGSKVRFKTTGALPTGLVADTDYYIIAGGFTTAAFQVSLTPGGAAVNFTGSQSGTQTGINAQFGVSADLTTFTVPDLRGRVTAGLDNMGGVAANRLTTALSSMNGTVMGSSGGVESHVLTTLQLPAHQHNNNPPDPTVSIGALTITVNSGGAHTHVWVGDVSLAQTGTAGLHNHAYSDTTSTQNANHTHGIPALTGVTSGVGDHSHGIIDNSGNAIEQATNSYADGGTHVPVQRGDQAGGTGIGFSAVGAGAHSHTIGTYASNTGTESAVHAHTFAGNTSFSGSHSHTLTGEVTGTITSAGAHTHTASATGTVTSALADFLSDNAGGGYGHPNVQPTFMVRKVLYVG